MPGDEEPHRAVGSAVRGGRAALPEESQGLQPIGLERMLRNHFPQHWLNLAHPACERALYGSASLCCLAGIDLGREAVPDATSLLRFRHSLERHQPGERLFAEAGRVLQGSGMTVMGKRGLKTPGKPQGDQVSG